MRFRRCHSSVWSAPIGATISGRNEERSAPNGDLLREREACSTNGCSLRESAPEGAMLVARRATPCGVRAVEVRALTACGSVIRRGCPGVGNVGGTISRSACAPDPSFPRTRDSKRCGAYPCRWRPPSSGVAKRVVGFVWRMRLEYTACCRHERVHDCNDGLPGTLGLGSRGIGEGRGSFVTPPG